MPQIPCDRVTPPWRQRAALAVMPLCRRRARRPLHACKAALGGRWTRRASGSLRCPMRRWTWPSPRAGLKCWTRAAGWAAVQSRTRHRRTQAAVARTACLRPAGGSAAAHGALHGALEAPRVARSRRDCLGLGGGGSLAFRSPEQQRWIFGRGRKVVVGEAFPNQLCSGFHRPLVEADIRDFTHVVPGAGPPPAKESAIPRWHRHRRHLQAGRFFCRIDVSSFFRLLGLRVLSPLQPDIIQTDLSLMYRSPRRAADSRTRGCACFAQALVHV